MSQKIDEISRTALEIQLPAINTSTLQRLCGALHASIKETVSREGLEESMEYVLENERKLTMLQAELQRRGINIKDPEFLKGIYNTHNKVIW